MFYVDHQRPKCLNWGLGFERLRNVTIYQWDKRAANGFMFWLSSLFTCTFLRLAFASGLSVDGARLDLTLLEGLNGYGVSR